jgi:hypothetical protein
MLRVNKNKVLYFADYLHLKRKSPIRCESSISYQEYQEAVQFRIVRIAMGTPTFEQEKEAIFHYIKHEVFSDGCEIRNFKLESRLIREYDYALAWPWGGA